MDGRPRHIKKPDVSKHRLFAFLTTSACDDVLPYC
jgi:hypothetical protein